MALLWHTLSTCHWLLSSGDLYNSDFMEALKIWINKFWEKCLYAHSVEINQLKRTKSSHQPKYHRKPKLKFNLNNISYSVPKLLHGSQLVHIVRRSSYQITHRLLKTSICSNRSLSKKNGFKVDGANKPVSYIWHWRIEQIYNKLSSLLQQPELIVARCLLTFSHLTLQQVKNIWVTWWRMIKRILSFVIFSQRIGSPLKKPLHCM